MNPYLILALILAGYTALVAGILWFFHCAHERDDTAGLSPRETGGACEHGAGTAALSDSPFHELTTSDGKQHDHGA